ncbi:MAG: mobilization protein MobD [Oceanobacter sp.]
MSAIHFVGGEKGGVGKSVFSRLLSQYCLDRGLHYAGLDADQSHGTTARYYEEFTRPLCLDQFESTDAIMELALQQEQQVVVDLPAQSQRLLDEWIEENGVIDMCDEMGVDLYYWHLMDDSPDSLQMLDQFLAKYLGRVKLVVVKNEGRGSVFTEIDALLAKQKEAVSVITLPALHANTMFRINKLGISFWAALNAIPSKEGSLSLMEKQRTKVWLHKSYGEVDSILLAPKEVEVAESSSGDEPTEI